MLTATRAPVILRNPAHHHDAIYVGTRNSRGSGSFENHAADGIVSLLNSFTYQTGQLSVSCAEPAFRPTIGQMAKPIACVVLPTYNEAENIPAVLPGIFSQADAIPTHELHVLVVDDSSPD